MTKQDISKKLKKILPYVLITIFAIVLGYTTTTLAKYVGTTSDEGEAVAGDFYFTSVLLQEVTDSEIAQVELYGIGTFVVNIYNTFEGKISDVDIDFEITVTGDATIAISEEDSKNYTISEESTTTKIIGTMVAGEEESHIAISVTPTSMEDNSTPIVVTATSTAPYQKTLSASFTSLNPDSFSGNVIATQTVLHENYTEFLIVAGSEFEGDVYVIIGDYSTIIGSYFPRDLDVATNVKYYYPDSTTGGIPTDDSGNPVVYNYVESLKNGTTDYTDAVFYIDLADIFYIEGQDYLKPNRTYVIDFLGEMQVDVYATEQGGIVYSDNTDGINSAVVFLTTDTYE